MRFSHKHQRTFKLGVLSLLSVLVTYSCTMNRKTMSPAQIKAKNYVEVVGDTANMEKLPDVFAKYPNGMEGIEAHLKHKTKYPASVRSKSIEGTVVVSYIVEKNGDVIETSVLKGVHPILDEEAQRVMTKMERWVPAMVAGEPVRIVYNQPVRFELAE